MTRRISRCWTTSEPGVPGSGAEMGVAIRRQLPTDAVRRRDRGCFDRSDVQQRPRAAALLACALSSGRRVPLLDARRPNRRDAVVEDGASRPTLTTQVT
jgi:hypothetical protein